MITEKEWVLASRLNQGYIIFIFLLRDAIAEYVVCS